VVSKIFVPVTTEISASLSVIPAITFFPIRLVPKKAAAPEAADFLINDLLSIIIGVGLGVWGLAIAFETQIIIDIKV
jgi:hypothetical protein